FDKTEVVFWELTDEEIENYVKSGEPLDKAGAYGIQGLGSLLVKKINGDYFSVVGLPVSRTARELRKLGYPLP
ncbi:MAG: Maf family protein, partial [Bacillales bacterium]